MVCTICEQLEKKEKQIIYQDERIAVALSTTPAAIGHLIVVPRQHFTIIEQVPDDILSEIFLVANKMAVILFETVNCHGTNLIVQNGFAAGQDENHFCIHVIPRRQGDNIHFNLEGKKATQEQLSDAKFKYDQYSKDMFVQKAPANPAPKDEKKQIKAESKPIKEDASSVNYLLHNIDKLP